MGISDEELTRFVVWQCGLMTRSRDLATSIPPGIGGWPQSEILTPSQTSATQRPGIGVRDCYLPLDFTAMDSNTPTGGILQ